MKDRIFILLLTTKKCRQWLVLLGFLCTVVSGARAQDFRPSTSTPYHTVLTHLHYLQPDSYDPAYAALAIHPGSVTDSSERVMRSIQLKQILDAEGLFVNLQSLPRDTDYTDSVEDEKQYTLFPEKRPEIYLVKDGDNWFYSPQSVDLIPSLHDELFPLGAGFLMNIFPEFGQKTFMGLALWQYLGFLIIIALTVLLYLLINMIFRPVLRRLLKRWIDDNEDAEHIKIIDKLAAALSLLFILQVICYIIPMLLLSIDLSVAIAKIISLVQIVLFMLVLMRVVDFFAYHLNKAVLLTDTSMDDQLLPIVKKSTYIFIVVGGLLHALSTLGVNVTALIAGVSIGGLAIALAAQDAVKNFIGSIMIFADKPFQIGDYIIGSGFEGEVVEVGFRTTRIKGIDTSVIAVPNGSIANMNIENKGARVMRLLNMNIGLTYDATPDQIRKFIKDLKKMIIDHPGTSDENFYVHLKEMADSSINVMFRAYIIDNTFGGELKIKEELYYLIMELMEKNGLDFAFPSQSIYIEKGG